VVRKWRLGEWSAAGTLDDKNMKGSRQVEEEWEDVNEISFEDVN
jgi:hypothetical protein